eukprot:133857_1
MLRRLIRLNPIPKHTSQILPTSCYHFQSQYKSFNNESNQFDRESVGALDELERTFVRPEFFCDRLKSNDFHFYCGVPDSLLKDLCGYITDHVPSTNHKLVPNEGSAIGLAAGYFLNTGKIPVVYFQNSGLGNAVNPLLSLTHQNVYSIPMLLIIGWRGEVGKKDEPQHLVMGNVMCDMLKLMQIPYDVLPDYEEGIQHSVQTAAQYLRTNNSPYALLVRKRTFTKYQFDAGIARSDTLLSRKETLRIIVNNIDPNCAIVSTTGFASRELNEVRQEYQQTHGCDEIKEFLTVGSMGHASAIALGIAESTFTDRDIVCIDGDGALLMHMGALSMIGNSGAKNIKHILINNGCHDSVGGQPTDRVDFVQIAQACGYKHAKSVENEEEITEAIRALHDAEGPYFLEIHTNYGADKNLSRPKATPARNKHDFMSFIDKTR